MVSDTVQPTTTINYLLWIVLNIAVNTAQWMLSNILSILDIFLLAGTNISESRMFIGHL
jgi:hypothetical protein